MRTNILRTNLLRLNEQLCLDDRRNLLQELGVGAHEMVAYLTGERVPNDFRIKQLVQFFGLPDQFNLKLMSLDDATMQSIRTVLMRYRKQRRNVSAAAA